jgi:protocatechuate 3,4-dioxygenase beta subunit
MMLQTLGAVLLALGFFTQSSVLPQTHALAQEAAAGRNLRVSGTVVDAASGQPLARARVFLTPADERDPGEFVLTGDDGRFAFENLAPGHYVLGAGRKGYVQQVYKQHEQFSTAIIVGPDLITENLRFELRPAASITGQVVDERNEPVRNARVILFHQTVRFGRHTNWREREVGTDDRGRYRFGHLGPGVYFVAASAQPWYAQRVTHQRIQQTNSSGQTTFLEFTNGEPDLDVVYPVTFFSHAEDLAGAVPITLHAGDSEVADFFLQTLPALHMLIHSSTSSENENVYAQVTQTLSNGSQMQVQANSQQIAPGLVEVGGLPPGKLRLGLVVSKEGESSTRWHNVELAGDMDISASETKISATVSGVVKFDENLPRRQVLVSLRLSSRSANEEFVMQADENGEFSLKDGSLPPGTYDLLVGQPAAAAVKTLSATGAKINGRSLEIGEGQDVKLSVVLSRGTGQISGVAVKDGKPVDGVMVVLVPEFPEQNLALFRRDQSDSDGSFHLNGVIPGKYTVVAMENAWELDWFQASVIKKYLAGGEALQVQADSRLEVKVKVQP